MHVCAHKGVCYRVYLSVRVAVRIYVCMCVTVCLSVYESGYLHVRVCVLVCLVSVFTCGSLFMSLCVVPSSKFMHIYFCRRVMVATSR